MTTDERPPCDAEIIGRDGKAMPFKCNLPAGHLGVKHAQTWKRPPECTCPPGSDHDACGWCVASWPAAK